VPTPTLDLSGRWTATWARIAVCVLLVAVGLQAHTTRSDASDAAAPRPAVAGEFTLTADEITIDGLRIEGTGAAPSDDRQRTTLLLTARQALATQLAVQAQAPAGRLVITCPADCLIAGRPARLYVLELTATPVVAGIPTVPITLSPTFPLPPPAALGILELPRLTFRDLRARLVLVTSDLVATPATRVDLLARG
jgi:hypothetical protein